MENIYEYINRPQAERQLHLKMDESCSEIGGSGSTEFKGLLAYYLGTTIPSHGNGHRIHLCHACGNAKCSNVSHLYWGTPKENHADKKSHGRYKSIHEHTLAKYGKDGVSAIAKRAGKAAGEANRKSQEHWESYRAIFESIDKTKRGWYGRLGKQLNLTQTTIRRIAKRLGMI
jgi:hypothetical protein